MPTKIYRTIQVNEDLYSRLTQLAKATAEYEHISEVTRPALLERMIHTYKEKLGI